MSIRVLLTYLALSLSIAYAQTYDSRYMAGLSAVFADYSGPMTGDLTQVKAFNPGISVGAYGYISSWFNASVHSAFFPEVIYPLSSGEFVGSSLTDVTALTQIKLNNGKLLAENSFLAPYITTGFGFNMTSGNTGFYVPAGVGMRMRVGKNFSLQFESMYKQALNSQAQHIAHTVGFVFALPSDAPVRKPTPAKKPTPRPELAANEPMGPDSDGDKVPDDRDQCPDVPGKVMYLGCPPPSEENTPKTGPMIVDISNDIDGDGVVNAEDKCPEVKGIITNGGCPITFDDVPQAPAPVSVANADNGRINAADEKYLADAMRMIHFGSASKEIDPVSYGVLDKIAEMMNRYPSYTLEITGHTDNTGSEKGNVVLSIQRAFEVKYYLAEHKGIRLARITSDGVADGKPISDNMSEEGRKLNRRVEFRLVPAGTNKNIADGSSSAF